MAQTNEIAHYDFGFIKPLDEKLLHEIFGSFENIITLEDGSIKGGFGSAVFEFAFQNNYSKNMQSLGIPDTFIEHGTIEELQNICGIDVDSLVQLFSKQKKKPPKLGNNLKLECDKFFSKLAENSLYAIKLLGNKKLVYKRRFHYCW